MLLSELSEKKVICMKDGSIIGNIRDCRLHDRDYCISDFIVVRRSGMANRFLPWFFPCQETTINVEDIVSIGEDVILVR